MSNEYKIKGSTLTSIANSIRNKTGKNNLINPLNMDTEIDSIQGADLTDMVFSIIGILPEQN